MSRFSVVEALKLLDSHYGDEFSSEIQSDSAVIELAEAETDDITDTVEQPEMCISVEDLSNPEQRPTATFIENEEQNEITLVFRNGAFQYENDILNTDTSTNINENVISHQSAYNADTSLIENEFSSSQESVYNADTSLNENEISCSQESVYSTDSEQVENVGNIESVNSSGGNTSANEDADSQQSVNDTITSDKAHPDSKRGRKRAKHQDEWLQNVRKRMRQSGKEYTNSRGVTSRAREVKTLKDCQGRCKFKCACHFTSDDRKNIFNSFWSLNDTEKNTFYANTTDRNIKERKKTKKDVSRRANSIKYHLVKGTDRIRVCKQFYLSTLDISAKRIEYFYKRSDTSFTDRRGVHSKKSVSEEARNFIREHINSFPRIPSHYCRATTNKKYLEADLSISKMYRLYQTKCAEMDIPPQTENIYRKIVNTEFNLGFFQPKKDRCDLCEEYKVVETHAFPIQTLKYDTHIKDKESTRKERTLDRENLNEEVTTVCFDMENVLTCPRSNVSNFFYKRKLNVFNLTAHCSSDKVAYNVLWNECLAGRGANEIASAFILILKKIVRDNPQTKKLVLWSDSCVPQNRNSIMSVALKLFLKQNPEIESIEQKFCTPGHSCIQEVDNIHSHIEKGLRKSEIYSPLSLVRKLKEIRTDVMNIHQMKATELYDFQEAASKLYFKDVPFSKVKSLIYLPSLPLHIHYKLSFGEGTEVKEACVRRQTRKSAINPDLPSPRNLGKVPDISDAKKKDVESMLKFMPQCDRIYMEKLLGIGTQRPK